ncbi:MAG: restriction endonuclease subunit S, partial [Daejeonella sp.]|uniref:restriction endonuclease subunit S n=1 Tax=Daejeonella sp. TaxID=2805397 RepID=UPI003C74D87B
MIIRQTRLPQGWEIKQLNDVCTIKGRIGYRGYTKQDLVKEGEGAISLSPSNIKNNTIIYHNCTYISWFKYDESPEIKIYDGDIIYCKTASIGKIALIENLPQKATINPQFVVLKEIKCSNKYLYFFMNSRTFKEQEHEIIGGTAIPTLSQANLGNLTIPLPSISEQQRIVSILDEAFASFARAKANAEQNLNNTKDLFESYLRGVFENRGERWEERTLKQVSNKFGRGKSRHRPRNYEKLYGGDYPFIQTGDIRNCNHYITEYSQTYSELGLAQSTLWPSGTICITIAANIAETGILTFDACFPDSVIGLVVNEKLADTDFIEYLLQSFKARI